MENILHFKVSSYETKEGTNKDNLRPKMVYFDEWFRSEKYKPLIEKIRSTTDEAEQKKQKLRLPCCTISEVIENGQKAHTGFIGIDLDQKDNTHLTNFHDLKKLLPQFDCVVYASLSARGEGYFLLVRISNPEKHKDHYESLKTDFARCGLVCDPECNPNVNRLRFYSWDPEPYINIEASIYNMVHAEAPAPVKEITSTPEQDTARVEALILEIEDSLTDITEGYNKWLSIAFALANTFGEDGREYFHRVSVFNDDYTPEGTDRLFTNCLKAKGTKEPVHINTLFHHAKEAGIILNSPEIDFKEQYIN